MSKDLTFQLSSVDTNLLKQKALEVKTTKYVFEMLIFWRQLCKGYCPLHFIAIVVIFSYSTFLNQSCLKSYMLPPKSKIRNDLASWNERKKVSSRVKHTILLKQSKTWVIIRPHPRNQAFSPFSRSGLFKLVLNL